MNTNALHNAINVLIVFISALAALDWTQFVTPEQATMVVGGLSLAKLLINVFRDGLSGLVKEQPPVQ